MFGHRAFQPVIQAIIELAERCAKDPWQLPEPVAGVEALRARLQERAGDGLRRAYAIVKKQERVEQVAQVKAEVSTRLVEEGYDAELVGSELKELERDIVRGAILTTGRRIDGRDTRTVRPITSEIGLLPRAHGSALFTRGETQALVVTTLGTGEDEQIIDALAGEYREHFLLHYNFPPYSVGEVGRLGSPGRREIGHGKLAWRAVRALLPDKEKFPYTIRVVSEITESNGSSSMATVCGASLSLMDAGVPVAKAIAGIAMGLIKEETGVAVLSDILGDEDHLGDMDFKVAGTRDGVTALQMDIKITSMTEEIMRQALAQARDGRMHILGEMAKAIDGSREAISRNAPRITIINIPKDKIREVIGSGGKVIREIVEVTGAKIDIEDDGTVKVAAVDASASQAAIDWIRNIVAEPEVGAIYTGKVVKIVDFGAFVNFLGSRDGLVHISELAPSRVKQVSDVVQVGDSVKVKVLGVDDRGKVKLSMKAVDQATGADLTRQHSEEPQAEQAGS
jgi:polyribonucleotide nucleotidyltransferase